MHGWWMNKETEFEKVQVTWPRTHGWSAILNWKHKKGPLNCSFNHTSLRIFLSLYSGVGWPVSLSTIPFLFSSSFVYFIQQLLNNLFLVTLENTNMNTFSLALSPFLYYRPSVFLKASPIISRNLEVSHINSRLSHFNSYYWSLHSSALFRANSFLGLHCFIGISPHYFFWWYKLAWGFWSLWESCGVFFDISPCFVLHIFILVLKPIELIFLWSFKIFLTTTLLPITQTQVI